MQNLLLSFRCEHDQHLHHLTFACRKFLPDCPMVCILSCSSKTWWCETQSRPLIWYDKNDIWYDHFPEALSQVLGLKQKQTCWLATMLYSRQSHQIHQQFLASCTGILTDFTCAALTALSGLALFVRHKFLAATHRKHWISEKAAHDMLLRKPVRSLLSGYWMPVQVHLTPAEGRPSSPAEKAQVGLMQHGAVIWSCTVHVLDMNAWWTWGRSWPMLARYVASTLH